MRRVFTSSTILTRRVCSGGGLWKYVKTRVIQKRSITIKSEGKFSCTKLSSSGEQERRVYTFRDLHRKGLLARDIFALNLFDESVARDYSKPRKQLKNRVPFIFSPRENSVIVSLGNVKSIIYNDHMLIFNPTKPVVKCWTNNLADTIPKYKSEYPDSTFELIVMEMILQELTEMFDRRLRIYNPLVNSLLSNVGSEGDAVEGVQKMVPLQDGVNAFEIEVREARQSLLDLLAEDEDMMGLLLTHSVGIEAGEANRGDGNVASLLRKDRVSVELLLEGYVARLSHALNEIIFMQQKMQSRANMATMVMTLQRNRIMRMNLHTSIAAVSIGAAGCIAGIFGMNLVHGYEETEGLFILAIGSMAVTVLSLHSMMVMKMFGWGGDTKKIQEEAERVEIMKSLLQDIGNIDHAIKIAFNRIDGGGDGIGLLGIKVKDIVDDNNTISKAEFRNLLLHSRGFLTGDASDNNLVVTDEYYKPISKEMSRTVDAEVDTFFMMLDKDKDGYLDMTEFVKSGNNY